VTFSGATGLGGNVTATVLNKEYQITYVDANSYTITVAVVANATDAAGSPGGGSVVTAYQLNVGPAVSTPLVGFGSGPWGFGPWGTGLSSLDALRVWSQRNFGEDLIFGPRGGGVYFWDATGGVTTRAVNLNSLLGASDVPTIQNYIFISDTFRFVFCFGCNDYGASTADPMLVRWSDQEDALNWTPAPTNQAGSIRLSDGSRIVTAAQTRQEILVWTDSSLYSFQYLGPPYVWGTNLLASNTSIVSPNAAVTASGVTYWMGVDKFYRYDGRIQTLRCDLRQYIFNDFNPAQAEQVFAGTNEGFTEIWWFYCSANSTAIDKYVVYNYAEDIWYYGTLGRTAWLDSGLREYPIAATYSNNIVNHEEGIDDNQTSTALAINAYIETSQFDIDDGHNFGFIWRILPDLTFRGSTAGSPQVTMYLYPYQNSGSGVNNPASVGGISNAPVTRVATIPVEQFTGQINTRVRGRQLSMKIESTQLGTTWQLGAPRIDIKQDGRR